jgi:hypothetical protein
MIAPQLLDHIGGIAEHAPHAVNVLVSDGLKNEPSVTLMDSDSSPSFHAELPAQYCRYYDLPLGRDLRKFNVHGLHFNKGKTDTQE